ncbi:hypothetical protein BFW01_g207 [Lasiodiplodia theobromae]|uniref:Uncharacterized protein n=1 Tax=Lasiodiplodia theobromae TaxID=45133 RepID=A0A8H7IR34_9PEZI|nr:hypothetical protein BFW01_g207 [Lasiodiplodia theobromae]
MPGAESPKKMQPKKDPSWPWIPPLQEPLGPRDRDDELEELKLSIKAQLEQNGEHWTTTVKRMGDSAEAHKRYLRMMKDGK